MKFKELQALLRRRFSLPKERPVRRTIQTFTLAERGLFYSLAAIFILSGLTLLWRVSDAYLVSVPTAGGSLTEGVVGTPRFINPVLALSEADKNLTALVYSGLLRLTPDGKLVNDLAENIEVSDNLLTYTVTLNSAARFHDGTRMTTDDIIFTVGKITDPLIKSPRRGNWEGVTVVKIDDYTMTFTLKKAYAPFIYNLTTGILPKHIWKNVTADEFSFSQFNTLPIGSGPYQIGKVERNEGGIPDYYELTPFAGALGGKAYLATLAFRFYPSEAALIDAYNSGDVESLSGISPEHLAELKKNGQVINSPLSRIFGVFFNQSHSKVLLEKSVRQALDLAAPRAEIVKDVFNGYATAINTPLPAGLYPWTTFDTTTENEEQNLTQAKKILADAGWKLNPETGLLEKKSGSDTLSLSFSISTGDAPELKEVADKLATSWGKLGAKVNVLLFETGELNQSVIRPRNFDALLFGEMVGKDADLYPFWHSSQRNDPGLNIALYANSKADKLLEGARSAEDQATVEENYKSFAAEIAKDVPAVFLYTPSFLYVMPDKVHSVALGSLLASPDRFANVRDWYVETNKVWKIFLSN